MKNRFTKRADQLRTEALKALGSIFGGCCEVSEYHSCYGFHIDDEYCIYDELIWLNGMWELVEHGTGNLYSVYNEPLQNLCSIIDHILEKYNQH